MVKKLCSGNAETYPKWKMQLDHAVKSDPCKSKSKLNMAEAMLYGDLLEIWKLWRYTEGAVEIEKKLMKRVTDKDYLKRIPRGDKDEKFKAYLGRLHNKFHKKYNAKKQKEYIRYGLIKPRSLYFDSVYRKFKSLITT